MWAFVAVAVSGCLYYLSIGLGTFWPAAWFAPVPVLLLAFRSSSGKAALAAFAAYFLGSLNLFSYFAGFSPVPLVLAILALPAAVYAGSVLLARAVAARTPAWIAVFAFPVTWTAYEFLVSLTSPHGTATSLAYSQASFLPAIQVASVTGLWGITFLVTLIPSAIAVAWARRDVRALMPALIVGLAALGLGTMRLARHPEEPRVRAGLAATDRGVISAFRTADPALALTVARAYADRVARLAAQGAQVIVLPEKFVGVTPADSDAIEQIFSQAARDHRVTVIAGFNRFSASPPLNQAVAFGPDGNILLTYEKHHMLPGPETGYEVGATPGLLPGPGAQWGVAICKDMDFPAWSRAYGRRDVRFLAVPAWDFVVDARLHSRMAVLRGVEEGFTIARSAQQGNLTFSDAYGRILAEISSSTPPDALLVANIPGGPGSTVYQRFGNWFGWTCVIAVAAFLVMLFRRPAHR